MTNYLNEAASPAATAAGLDFRMDRRQTKQEIEKFRRDRMNISMEELKGYLVKYIPNQTTKLEKADILEQTVTLLGKLTAEKERAFNDGVKRGMMDVCNMLIKSGIPEAQKAAHDIMLSIRPPPGIQFPAGMPMHRPPMMMPPPVPGGPFGFMGFPGMGIPPPMMMQMHQQQQQLMKQSTQPLRPTPQPQNAQPTSSTVKKEEPEAEAHTSDEEVDIENVEDQNDETFSDASTPGSSRGTKRKYSSSDDSGIADAVTPKMPKSEKKINFGIDRFLVS
uniref:BHLH domain-containing protein n=1 Tax=Panagrellus redivivus TaxID=6233 RepID=A0A7E4W1M2_PANRE